MTDLVFFKTDKDLPSATNPIEDSIFLEILSPIELDECLPWKKFTFKSKEFFKLKNKVGLTLFTYSMLFSSSASCVISEEKEKFKNY